MEESDNNIKDIFLRLAKERYRDDIYLISRQKRPRYSQKTLINELRNSYSNNELVLVLGAGVSASCNIPTWDRLMDYLLSDTFGENKNSSTLLLYPTIFKYIYKPNYLMAAKYISNYYLKENYEENKFVKRVRELLYSDVIGNSKLISEIADLCVKYRNIDSVITYNYDDLLEKNIKSKNCVRSFESIYNNNCELEQNMLPIYHVHGFLPQSDIREISTKIVLTEDDYHEQYQNIYSWQNIIQIDKFSNKPCLFIGISLTDPNMRRLLGIAKLQLNKGVSHYIIKERKKYDNIESLVKKFANDKDNEAMARLFATINKQTTLEIIKKIHDFEEEDALSFNLRTLWVKSLDDIPELLKKININKDETPNP